MMNAISEIFGCNSRAPIQQAAPTCVPMRELPTEMREQLEDLGVYPSRRANRQKNKDAKKEEARNEVIVEVVKEDAKKENAAENIQKAKGSKKEDVQLEMSPRILARELPTEMREQLEDAGIYPNRRQGILKKSKETEKKGDKKQAIKEEDVKTEENCQAVDGVAVTVDSVAPCTSA